MVTEWSNSVTIAVTDTIERVASYLPNIIAAIVVLLIGIVLGWAVKTVVTRIAGYLNVRSVTETVGLDKVFKGKVDVKGLIGDIAQWIVIIVFLTQALEILNLSQVNEAVEGVIAYLPSVIAAVFIILIGAVVADLASKVVSETSKTIGAKTADVLADVARYAIIIFVILAALSQLGIATVMLNTLFTGFVALVAIAGGLAFGLGGQNAAGDMIQRVRKNLPK